VRVIFPEGQSAGGTLHHIGIVVSNLSEAVRQYGLFLGRRNVSEPFHDRIQRVNVCFLEVAPASYIEFIEPAAPDSPVSAFLRKRQGGLHHVAFEVADVQAVVDQRRALGHKVVCEPTLGFDNRTIAFIVPRVPNTVLVEYVSPRPAP